MASGVIVITAIQNEPEAQTNDLMVIEWAYLPILNEHNNAAPRTLDRMLASSPDFFCEIIRMIFRSSHERDGTPEGATPDQPKTEEATEERQAKARNAYEMLHQWRTLPGTNMEEDVSRDALMHWLNSVKDSTLKSGHFVIAMQHAGEVFQHAPADPDGLWMHRGVAEALNRPDMDELRTGYSIGVYNARGVHWVDPTGAPEKALVATWAQRADQIENAGFHRLAGTLRSMSQKYAHEAQVVIKEAQLD